MLLLMKAILRITVNMYMYFWLSTDISFILSFLSPFNATLRHFILTKLNCCFDRRNIKIRFLSYFVNKMAVFFYTLPCFKFSNILMSIVVVKLPFFFIFYFIYFFSLSLLQHDDSD